MIRAFFYNLLTIVFMFQILTGGILFLAIRNPVEPKGDEHWIMGGALLVIVLLAGSFGAMAAVFMGDFGSLGTYGMLAGSAAVAAAGGIPLFMVRKARARWLAGTAIYDSYRFFVAHARDRAGRARDAVDVARADGILGHAIGQAGERELITPGIVFYRQLQAKRASGEMDEASFCAAIDDLLENEVAWRRAAKG